MKQHAKHLYEKMIDYKRFAAIMLAIGAFFYLGMILPSDTKSPMDVNIMILISLSFLTGSILFFFQSKQCQLKLIEMEDGQDHIDKR